MEYTQFSSKKYLKVGGVALIVILILSFIVAASVKSHKTKPLNLTIEGESSLVEGEISRYNCTVEGGTAPYNISLYETLANYSGIQENVSVPEGGSISLRARTGYKHVTLVCHIVDSRGGNAQAVKVIDVIEAQAIFVAGDYTSSTSRSTELVDVAPGCSCNKSTTDLKEKRWGHSLDIIHNRFIICGGAHTVIQKSCVWSSSTAGPWSHHSTTNIKRHLHSSVSTGESLHLIGGFYSEGTMETLVNGSWVVKMLPYQAGSGSCAVQISTESFIVTGGGGYNSQRTTYQRGPGDKWTKLKDMQQGRSGHSCGIVTVDNKKMIIVAGGSHILLQYSSELYDIESGQWSKAGDLVKARNAGRIVSINSRGGKRLFILGGENNGNCLNSMEEFSVNNSSWTLSSAKMKYPRFWFGAVAISKSFCN